MAEKVHSKREKIFYLVILPFIFTLILTGILLSFLGVPVWKSLHQWGSQIPLVKSVFHDTTNKQSPSAASSNPSKSQTLQEIQQKQSANQQELDTLKAQNVALQQQLAEKQRQKNQEDLQQSASLFENMSSSKASAILNNLPMDEAAFTLSGLDEEQQSGILGSLSDTKKAAQLSTMLKEIAQNQDEDPYVLKKRIHDLAQKYQTPPGSTLVATISAMPPAQAAGIIENMMGTNTDEAIYVMKSLNTNIRSQILTEITKSDAKLAARISTYMD